MPSIRKTLRAGAAVLTATILLATTVAGASARNLSVSNQNIRVTWSSLEFTSAATIRCRITVEGSFHARTSAKARGTLSGAVTRIDVDTEACTGGRGKPRSELLPGHITYEGFTGTLPNINSVLQLLSRTRFQIILAGICTGDYGNERDNITSQTSVSGGELSTLNPVSGRNTKTLVSGGAFCPRTAGFVGLSNAITVSGTTTKIRLFLI